MLCTIGKIIFKICEKIGSKVIEVRFITTAMLNDEYMNIPYFTFVRFMYVHVLPKSDLF